jgi:phage gp36-like protein
MAAYATYQDMTKRYDERTIKDLVSDSGVPAVSLSGNGNLEACLDDATGAIKAALLVGGMYQESDLDSLSGESGEYLKRITCEIALAYLILRRPDKYGKASQEVRESQEALLEMFRGGARVFNIDENKAAGLPTIGGPSWWVYERLNMIPDRTRNYYPRRITRLPIGR